MIFATEPLIPSQEGYAVPFQDVSHSLGKLFEVSDTVQPPKLTESYQFQMEEPEVTTQKKKDSFVDKSSSLELDLRSRPTLLHRSHSKNAEAGAEKERCPDVDAPSPLLSKKPPKDKV